MFEIQDAWLACASTPRDVTCLALARPSLQIKASEDELAKERDCVGHLIPNQDAAACALVGSEDTWVPGDK